MTEGAELSWLECEEPIYLGISSDQRHLYAPGEPGIECLAPKPVYLTRRALDHIIKDHPDRLKMLEDDCDIIRLAVQEPEIVYKHLDHKSHKDYWSQACIIKHLRGTYSHLIVVVSLARVSGEDSDSHQVTTIYPIKERDLYKKLETNASVIKDRWLEVAK